MPPEITAELFAQELYDLSVWILWAYMGVH